MPFREEGAEELLPAMLASGRLTVTDDEAVLGQAENIIVVVGTPVDRFLNPDIGAVLTALEAVMDRFVDGQLIILRSTVYPGVTTMVAKRFRELGRSVDVAFCPERIAEGQALLELGGLPQIVSGCDPRASERLPPCSGSSPRRSSSCLPRRRSLPSSSPTLGGTSSSPSPTNSS